MLATAGRGRRRTKKKPPTLQVRDLLDRQSASLGLELIAGKTGLARRVRIASVQRPRFLTTTGRSARQKTDELEPGGVLLLSTGELAHLGALPARRRKRLLETLMGLPVAAVVVPAGRTAPSELYDIARRRRVAVLATKLPSPVASKRLSELLGERLAPRQVVHGVLMDVHGLGILILGESGIGKSESAIELIERGHRLVADDVVEIQYDSGSLKGRSPEIVRYYMELRGLGVINIKDLFGASAIQLSIPVQLVIQLERWDEATEVERLGLEEPTYTVLGVDLPLIRMPVGPGRNLAMLIEVAARNHLMNAGGRRAARLLARSVSKAARRRRR